MTPNRLPDYLAQIAQAAERACAFVEGTHKPDFLVDIRTQQAVILNLMIIGEAATKLLQRHAGFADQHPHIPWRSMQGMRNRIAQGYFEIDLDVVWDTVQFALPELSAQLPAAQAAAEKWLTDN